MRCWIFDMDGTLTQPVHDFDDIRFQLGIQGDTPILEAIATMPDSQARETTRRLNEIEMAIADSAQPQPGCDEVLGRLTNEGCQLGVLTRNGDEIARRTLSAAGLDRFFASDSIIGRDSCQPKPSPEGIEQLLTRWNAPATQAVMIGDYLFDLQAGRNASVFTIHLDHTEQFPWPALTDATARDWSEIEVIRARWFQEGPLGNNQEESNRKRGR